MKTVEININDYVQEQNVHENNKPSTSAAVFNEIKQDNSWVDILHLETLEQLFPEHILNAQMQESTTQKETEIKAQEIFDKLNQLTPQEQQNIRLQKKIVHEYEGHEPLSPWQTRHDQASDAHELIALLRQEFKYQAQTSPIANTSNGFSVSKLYYRYTNSSGNISETEEIQPMHFGRKLPVKISPYIDIVPLKQYERPIQPMIIPPILFRPNQKLEQMPIWVRDTRGTHHNIHRNIPIGLDFITKYGTNEDSYLIYHITMTHQPHYGKPVVTCNLQQHRNRRTPGSPLYIEAALRKEPWLRHFQEYQINNHHYCRLNKLTGVRTIYFAFPCHTACAARNEKDTSYWFLHCEGIFNNEYAIQTVPIQVKSRLQMPPKPDKPRSITQPFFDKTLAQEIYTQEPEIIRKLKIILLPQNIQERAKI